VGCGLGVVATVCASEQDTRRPRQGGSSGGLEHLASEPADRDRRSERSSARTEAKATLHERIITGLTGSGQMYDIIRE